MSLSVGHSCFVVISLRFLALIGVVSASWLCDELMALHLEFGGVSRVFGTGMGAGGRGLCTEDVGVIVLRS
jgi:hypothetical protein